MYGRDGSPTCASRRSTLWFIQVPEARVPAACRPATLEMQALRRIHLQVFLADQCQLRHFDAAGFEACMTGRRLFLIGALLNPHPDVLASILSVH